MNETIRNQFPSLKRKIKNKPCIYLDGPAGTQVPESVIKSISQYYRKSNANTHGTFATSVETDKVMSSTRDLVACFLGAEGGHNISLGQNMTSLNYSLARALGRYFHPGDEILITQLDHESNRGPWLSLQSEGIIVREVNMKSDGTLDYKDFENKIGERTRLVCMGLASNISGAVNNVELIRKLSYKVAALLLIDAVHYAPHFSINVSELGCDFLLCSGYKFYGPHVGILYSKTGLLDMLPTDRLRTSSQHAPYSIETGTLNHAAIAGVKASIEFIESLGKGNTRSARLENAMTKITSHERKLATLLFKGLKTNKNIEIVGPSFSRGQRAPTISFIHKSKSAIEICKFLATENIFTWAGHFYAIRATEVLGLLEKGGVVRMGMSVYCQSSDIKKTLDCLKNLQ